MATEDLKLSLLADGDGFRVQADFGTQSDTEPFSLVPDSTWNWENLRQGGPAAARKAGIALFEALIHGKVRVLYDQSRGQVKKGELRIRLVFDPRVTCVRQLLALPWELLLDPKADSGKPLALSTRVLLVRELSCNEPVREPPPGDLKQVLIATANPRGTPALDLRSETSAIKKELGHMGLKPEILDKASVAQLGHAIPSSAPQIFHFMGHGLIDEKICKGTLLLETPQREIDPLEASEFVALFADTPPPRLVVLTACFSGAATSLSQSSSFSSVAAALVAAGLPAVLAMQTTLQDSSAPVFSQRLYQFLCSKQPIESAVRAARSALSLQQRGSMEWAVPVLYTREIQLEATQMETPTKPPPPARSETRKSNKVHGNVGVITDQFNNPGTFVIHLGGKK
jgi:CHAT domain